MLLGKIGMTFLLWQRETVKIEKVCDMCHYLYFPMLWFFSCIRKMKIKVHCYYGIYLISCCNHHFIESNSQDDFASLHSISCDIDLKIQISVYL